MDVERHVKGLDLLDLVKSIRAVRKAGRLPEQSASDQQLVDQRILVSSWYPFETFLRLLHLAHEQVFGGTDEAAQMMGSFGAQVSLTGVHGAFLRPDDPLRTMRALERIWPVHFDFGKVTVEATEHGHARVIISGYDDMQWVHGRLLLGWVSKAAQLGGGQIEATQLEEAPWEGDARYALLLRLGPPGDEA